MSNWMNSNLEPDGLSEPWVTFGYLGGALAGAIVAMGVVALVATLVGIPL